MNNQPYAWRVGDVFTDGTHRWAVDAVHGERAIMRSLGSSWATTILLTFSEWSEGGRWHLEAPVARCAVCGNVFIVPHVCPKKATVTW